jgi:NAD(P)-dependent dehydrogenase (short-subunit alcohol dehydrogenase family)
MTVVIVLLALSAGIGLALACLAINQAAYVVGAIRTNNGPKDGSVEDLPQQRADDEPHDGRDDDIRSEHKRQHNDQFELAQLTN